MFLTAAAIVGLVVVVGSFLLMIEMAVQRNYKLFGIAVVAMAAGILVLVGVFAPVEWLMF